MINGYLRNGRPQGHPQHHRRRLPGGVRASCGARDRLSVPRPRRASDRLPGLLSQRLLAQDAGAFCARIRTWAPRCSCRSVARDSTKAGCWRPSASPAARRPWSAFRIPAARARPSRDGLAWVEQTLQQLENTPRAQMRIDELVVGTICGGSDATSGLTANPSMGRAFDFLVEQNATCIFEETGELIGMEHWMAERAETPELGQEIIDTVAKAARYYTTMGHASFAPGNADGGLTHHRRKVPGRLCQERAIGRSRASSSRATCRFAAGSICSMWCRTASRASAFPTSATTPRSPS